MSKWDELTMAEKAEMMKVAVRNGITKLQDIRDKYNEFAEGGGISDEKYYSTMEKVAEDNYQKWGLSNPDEALVHALNDNTYNYRGYYNKYPQSEANADTHWTDEFKTVYHPTFSVESSYSGQKSQYNPQGLYGGHWVGDKFIPAPWQIENTYSISGPLVDWAMEKQYGSGGSIHIKPENRGKFTALKKRTGHSATWFKEHGTPAQKKMAVFALNSRKWKHGLGGNLFYEGGDESDHWDLKRWGKDLAQFPKDAWNITKEAVTENLPDIGISDIINYAVRLGQLSNPTAATKSLAKGAMSYIHSVGSGEYNPIKVNWLPLSTEENIQGVPQNAFLLPRFMQEKEFLNAKYIKGKEGDYGLVKKAVGNRKFPVWQTAPDAIDRSQLIPLGNINDVWFGPYKAELEHPGHFPTAIYTDGHGNFYQKAWDLNDYGGEGGSTAGFAGKVLDMVGNPTVVTTGFQPIRPERLKSGALVGALEPMMEKKGLVPTEIDGKTAWTLPEITITGKKKKALGGNLYGGGGFTTIWNPINVPITIRNAMYKNISPYDNYDLVEFAKNITGRQTEDYLKGLIEDANWKIGVFNDPKEGYEEDHKRRLVNKYNRIIQDAEVADELYATYLGIPIEKRHYDTRLKKSKYRNAVALPTDTNDWRVIIKDTRDLNVGKNKNSDILGKSGIFTHAIGRGYDKKGEYVSYGDSYDLNPFRGKAATFDIPLLNKINDVSLGLFHPVEVYDRMYLDDYYGVKEPTHATYLPEITVTGKKRKKASGGNIGLDLI